MRIVVSKIGMRFKERIVLDAVDLESTGPESVALVGPSGSGKSTLLAIIGGLLRPNTGSVAFAEPSVPQISWIFQTTNLLPRRSVLDNAALGAVTRLRSIDRASPEVREVLESVGLGDRAGLRANRLSGGERQRLVVARALLARPHLLIADEPTAQLDRHNANLVAEALVGQRPPTTTVILATHDPAVAGVYDRAVKLDRGSLIT